MSNDKHPTRVQAVETDSDIIYKGSAHAEPPNLPPVHPTSTEMPKESGDPKSQ